jgi:hypothetical protein
MQLVVDFLAQAVERAIDRAPSLAENVLEAYLCRKHEAEAKELTAGGGGIEDVDGILR